MNATLYPNLLSAESAWLSDSPIEEERTRDLSNPEDFPDMLGTTCRIHRAPRFLEEVPVVSPTEMTIDAELEKRRSFPNSWTAVARSGHTHSALVGKRVQLVRYCADCRRVSSAWLQSFGRWA